MFGNFYFVRSHLNRCNSLLTSAFLLRYSNVRTMHVGIFTILSVFPNCNTLIAKSGPPFSNSMLLLDWNSCVMCINVVCVMEKRIRMIRICSLQYAGSAQQHITGSVCPGFLLYWIIEEASVILCPVPFLLIRLIKLVFFSLFVLVFPVISPLQQRKAPMATFFKGRGMAFFVIKFWYTACMLVLSPLSAICCTRVTWLYWILCRKHEIIKEIGIPRRKLIIFPEAKKFFAPKDPESTPKEQDILVEQELLGHPASEPSETPPPPATVQNQCFRSNPMDSFAPSSLYIDPYPGSCGWLDDWPSIPSASCR